MFKSGKSRRIPSRPCSWTLFSTGTTHTTTTRSAYATSALVFGAANGIGLGISLCTASHIHLDLIGTGAFVAAAMALRGSGGCTRQRMSALCVGIWGTKLAGFLFYRALQTKHDARLGKTLSSPSGTIGFWGISFVWGFLVALPHTIAAAVPHNARPRFGHRLDRVGVAMFCAGLALETSADLQKWRFKNEPANLGKHCDVGVWQLSQHPNWLGNLILWGGVLTLNAPTLLSLGVRRSHSFSPARMLAAVLSPGFLLVLFMAQASGKLTDTVELAEKKYGASAEYQLYVSTTPLIFPTPKNVAGVNS